MAPNLAMGTTLAAHDVGQIKGQAINQQQVSSRTVLPESAVEAGRGVDGMAEVEVHDTGGGLAADAVDRLFEPYFTTKAGGLGMGLAISRSIIEDHGGQLRAESSDGPGTTFQFTLLK